MFKIRLMFVKAALHHCAKVPPKPFDRYRFACGSTEWVQEHRRFAFSNRED